MKRLIFILLLLQCMSSCWLQTPENKPEQQSSETRYYAEQNDDKTTDVFQNGEPIESKQVRFDSLLQFFTTDTSLLNEEIFIHQNWNGECVRYENSLTVAVTSHGPVIFSCLPYYNNRLQPDSLVAIAGDDRYTCITVAWLQLFQNRENFYIYYFKEDEAFAFISGIRKHRMDSITVKGYNNGITSYSYELNERDKEAISTSAWLCENYIYRIYQ